MSPEQTGFGGLEVDHRTDIYSLGVVLYELIAGETPFLRETEKLGAPMGWITVIREQEPPRPSTLVMRLGDVAPLVARSRGITEARGLARLLAEDLDWIILRCLEKDRDQRYASAAALAEDLQRFLDQRPIVAVRQGVIYRLKKLARRRRDLVRLASVFAVVLAVVTAASYALWRSARVEARAVTLQEDMLTGQALLRRQPQLPAIPVDRRRNDLRTWLAEAENVLSRKAQSLAARDELRTAMENPASASESLRELSRSELQRQLTDAERLVEVITSLEAADGPRAIVQSWLKRSPSPEEVARRWQEVDRGTAADLEGLVIPDRGWLVPLGRHPETLLWEFADLQLGLEPVRDEHGVRRCDAVTGVVYVLIPGGTFRMGSPEDEPGRKLDEDLHDVTLSPFLISKYEVTQGQWIRAMDALPGSDERLDYPVGGVTWMNAVEFCQRTNCRLPSEAQWEAACRAGSELPFSGAEVMDDLGWYETNSDETRQRVGMKQPNAFGLFDVHGNALEWCQDVYLREYYTTAEARGPDPVHDPDLDPKTSPIADRVRVLRGGSYEGKSQYCRSADRYREIGTLIHGSFGLRPVRLVVAK
jgi:formylglycine-generating enzyme required for sulfatase activity